MPVIMQMVLDPLRRCHLGHQRDPAGHQRESRHVQGGRARGARLPRQGPG